MSSFSFSQLNKSCRIDASFVYSFKVLDFIRCFILKMGRMQNIMSKGSVQPAWHRLLQLPSKIESDIFHG